MILEFRLTMPNPPSWNGKWSAADKLHAIVVDCGRGVGGLERAQKIINGSPYQYRWDDGWCASIAVREVDATDARKIRRMSAGFAGYDWMVDSIRKHLEIRREK